MYIPKDFRNSLGLSNLKKVQPKDFGAYPQDFEAGQPGTFKIEKNMKDFSFEKAQNPNNFSLRRAISQTVQYNYTESCSQSDHFL